MFLAALCAACSLGAFAQTAAEEEASSVVSATNQITDSQKIMLRFSEVGMPNKMQAGFSVYSGDLMALKNSTGKVLVKFNWDPAMDARQRKLLMVGPAGSKFDVQDDDLTSRCIKDYELKFVEFFNEKNKKGVQLTTDANADYEYVLDVIPCMMSFTQMKIAGSSTHVIIGGIMDLLSKDGSNLCTMYFNRDYKFAAKLGNAGVSESNTLKTWRCVAEQVDDDLLAAIKKAKPAK